LLGNGSGLTSENTTPLSKQKSLVINYDSNLKKHKFDGANYYSSMAVHK